MDNNDAALQADVQTVSSFKIVPVILQMICHTTGMGFAAVARVTPERWIALQVEDRVQFGLMPGGELVVDTTICHEIRQSGKAVIINHVAEDEFYRTHHTPAQYGLQSYISVPIQRRDGTFFGTLCAIDPHPAVLSGPEVISMFRVFTQLISFHLNAAETLPVLTAKLLENRSTSLLNEQYKAISGQDLHMPHEESSDVITKTKRHTIRYAEAMKQLTIALHDHLADLEAAIKE